MRRPVVQPDVDDISNGGQKYILQPDGSFTARAAVRIDRTDFGITASRGLAARYLDVSAEFRCVRRG